MSLVSDLENDLDRQQIKYFDYKGSLCEALKKKKRKIDLFRAENGSNQLHSIRDLIENRCLPVDLFQTSEEFPAKKISTSQNKDNVQ